MCIREGSAIGHAERGRGGTPNIGHTDDRCANQLEHLESLLLSHLATTAHEHYGDMGKPAHYAHAVESLHRALLAPWLGWRVHTSLDVAAQEADASSDPWSFPDPQAQLEDITLYLLIWGEAANLRFMPELLCFLFEVARAHVSSDAFLTASVTASLMASVMPSLDVKPVKPASAETEPGSLDASVSARAEIEAAHAAELAEAAAEAEAEAAMRPSFLRDVVSPIYAEVRIRCEI